MNTIQDIASHLHRIQADSRSLFGDDYHDAHVENGEVIRCDSCDGGLARVKYCWEYQLQRLIISKNGPGFLKDIL